MGLSPIPLMPEVAARLLMLTKDRDTEDPWTHVRAVHSWRPVSWCPGVGGQGLRAPSLQILARPLALIMLALVTDSWYHK